MGFMGLDSCTDSDNASGLAGAIVAGLATGLDAALKEEGDQWNTPGCINVALFFEEYIIPAPAYCGEQMLVRIAKQTLRQIIVVLKTKWGKEPRHKDSLLRMRQSLTAWIEASKL